MKKCENCNLILQDSDAFCPKCGGATVECDSGSHAEGETACNCGENCSCGEENRECGEQTAENVQAGPQMQFVDDGKKKKGKKGLIAAIIVNIIKNRKKKTEGFPLIPYLAVGFMAAYFM